MKSEKAVSRKHSNSIAEGEFKSLDVRILKGITHRDTSTLVSPKLVFLVLKSKTVLVYNIDSGSFEYTR